MSDIKPNFEEKFEVTRNEPCKLSITGIHTEIIIKEEKIEPVNECMLNCKFCNKPFPTTAELKLHDCLYPLKTRFQCRFCNQIIKWKWRLLEHEQAHTKEKPLQCKVCYRRFTSTRQFVRHEKIHINKKEITCSQCNKIFNSTDHFKQHEKCHKKVPDKIISLQPCFSEEQFTCTQCNKTFNSRGTLEQHAKCHVKIPIINVADDLECKFCKKPYPNKQELDLHQWIHTVKYQSHKPQ